MMKCRSMQLRCAVPMSLPDENDSVCVPAEELLDYLQRSLAAIPAEHRATAIMCFRIEPARMTLGPSSFMDEFNTVMADAHKNGVD